MTVVAGGVGDLQSFWIGKSDFWTDGVGYEMTNEEYDNYVVSPIVVGRVRMWIRDFEIPLYRQELDLETAELRGRFEAQGQVVETRAWVCAVENVMVLEVAYDGPGPVGCHFRAEAKNNDDPGVAELPTGSGVEADVLWSTRETWDRGRWASRVTMAMRVLGTNWTKTWTGGGGAGRHSNGAVLLRPGDHVTVVVALAGGKDARGHRETAVARASAIDLAEVERLRAAHHAWWREFWGRSAIDLGGDVVERFWYGAQYALACCSRPGAVCPGIFGFSTDDHPRWSGDYHLNYNAEHPFAGVFSSNRSELARSYVQAMWEFLDEGKRRAARDLKPPMPGVYFPIGLGPWGVVAQDSYMSQKCAAAYAAWPMIEWFYHEPDAPVLRERVYPFCLEVGEFWSAYLVEEGGKFHIKGSASHEHGGHDVDANFDLPLVRRLFLALVAMSERLGVDEGKRERWKDIVARLAEYPTAKHQGKRVFKESANCEEFTRSISLFNVMWPGAGDVGLWGDAGLLEAGRNTLEALALWEQGNSFSWVFPAAVRVGLPGVYERLRWRLERSGGLRENLTVAQAYGGIETFGTTAAVNEMLMQSYDGVIHLFPVWQRERDARFTGLRAYGGHVVAAELRGGEVRRVEIIKGEGTLRVESPWEEGCVVEVQGKVVATGRGVVEAEVGRGVVASVMPAQVGGQ
jgi:hypothetical protein